MNSSHNATDAHYGFVDADPDMGLYDLRIFWIAAGVAMLAVLAVAYFKMAG